MTLMEKLIAAGYPEKNIFHHYSDLYVFATETTTRVIREWCNEHGYAWDLFVIRFRDNVTGRQMYDIAFQYDPYWRMIKESCLCAE